MAWPDPTSNQCVENVSQVGDSQLFIHLFSKVLHPYLVVDAMLEMWEMAHAADSQINKSYGVFCITGLGYDICV
jgi:hypothetical protein